MAMRISVIIPTYNRADFLPLAVESVLRQSHPVSEIIIVDDGSQDGTGDVIDSLKGPLVKLRQSNQGAAAARNRGLSEARYELVALLDSDDLWHPDKLERQVRLLESQPETGLVHTAARLIDVLGCPTGEIWGRKDYHGLVFSRLMVRNGVNASSVLARREALLNAGGWDPQFRALENWDLWLRVAKQWSFAYLEEPLIDYRWHTGNVMQDLERVKQAYERLHQKHLYQPTVDAQTRRTTLAAFHAGFADRYVARHEYRPALHDFAESLRQKPLQVDVLYRMTRVAMAHAQEQLRFGPRLRNLVRHLFH